MGSGTVVPISSVLLFNDSCVMLQTSATTVLRTLWGSFADALALFVSQTTALGSPPFFATLLHVVVGLTDLSYFLMHAFADGSPRNQSTISFHFSPHAL